MALKVVERGGKKFVRFGSAEFEVVKEEWKTYKVVYHVKRPDGSVLQLADIIDMEKYMESEEYKEELRAIGEAQAILSEVVGQYELSERQEAILNLLAQKNEWVPLKVIANKIAPKFGVSKDTILVDLKKLVGRDFVRWKEGGLYKISDAGWSYLGSTPPRVLFNCVWDTLVEVLSYLGERANAGDEKARALFEEVVTTKEFCLKMLGHMHKDEWELDIDLGGDGSGH